MRATDLAVGSHPYAFWIVPLDRATGPLGATKTTRSNQDNMISSNGFSLAQSHSLHQSINPLTHRVDTATTDSMEGEVTAKINSADYDSAVCGAEIASLILAEECDNNNYYRTQFCHQRRPGTSAAAPLNECYADAAAFDKSPAVIADFQH